MALTAPEPPHRRRPAPQIYRVPPPVATRRFVLLAAIGPGAVAVAMGGMIALTEWARDPGAAWNDIHTAAVGLVALGVVATVFIGVAWGAINRRRARFVADHGLPAEDALTRKLNDLPRPPAFLPRNDQIYQALQELDFAEPGAAPGARIVLVGAVIAPPVEDEVFAPEIITPSRLLLDGHGWLSLGFGSLLLALWVIPSYNFVGLRVGERSLLLIYGGLIVGPLMFTWLARVIVAPQYIRMAPGVIQTLRYSIFRRKPTVETFAMGPRVSAVITRHWKNDLSLTMLETPLSPLEQPRTVTIPISDARYAGEAADAMWRALLSTAPTPPLADDALVG